MTTHAPTDEDIHLLVRRVLTDWKLAELKSIRNSALVIQDKIDKMDHREAQGCVPNPDLRSRLKQQAKDMANRKDAEVTMIEDAYQRMIAFVDRRECEAD